MLTRISVYIHTEKTSECLHGSASVGNFCVVDYLINEDDVDSLINEDAASSMAAASEPQAPPQCIPSGKHSGQSVDTVWAVDPQYVWFLSQRNLTHVQLLRYKAFFDSCPGAVHRAQELTEGIGCPR
jgi:hypothetical protein